MSFQHKLLSLVVVTVLPFCARAEIVTTSLSGTQLNITVPAKFVRCEATTPQGQIMLKMARFGGNQNLVCLISSEDIAFSKQHSQTRLTEYGLVEVQKGLETQTISAQDFARLKAEMRKQAPANSLQQLTTEGGMSIKEFLNSLSPETAAKLRFVQQQQIILEIIDSSPRLYSTVFLQKNVAIRDGRPQEATVIGVMSMIRIKERLIQAVMVRVLHSKDDFPQLRQQALNWANEIISANM